MCSTLSWLGVMAFMDLADTTKQSYTTHGVMLLGDAGPSIMRCGLSRHDAPTRKKTVVQNGARLLSRHEERMCGGHTQRRKRKKGRITASCGWATAWASAVASRGHHSKGLYWWRPPLWMCVKRWATVWKLHLPLWTYALFANTSLIFKISYFGVSNFCFVSNTSYH